MYGVSAYTVLILYSIYECIVYSMVYYWLMNVEAIVLLSS